jgi:hypothetical protein
MENKMATFKEYLKINEIKLNEALNMKVVVTYNNDPWGNTEKEIIDNLNKAKVNFKIDKTKIIGRDLAEKIFQIDKKDFDKFEKTVLDFADDVDIV